jgi:hypothetical protein
MTTVVLNTTTRKLEAFSSARDAQARAYGHDSRAALEAASVPAGIPLLFLRSYAQAGDGGAAYYKRAASEPGHAGKIRSADGAWWELAEPRPTPQMFGALHGIFGGADLATRLSVIGGRIAAIASQRGINGGFRSLRCSGVRFEGGAYGIVWSNSVAAAEDGEITGCVFEGQTIWGVSTSTNSRGLLTGCTFRSTNGFRTLPTTLDWLLSGNDFSAVSGIQTSDGNGLLAVVGLDTAGVDLQLTPKSSGYVRFGTHSAIGAEALSGYIEIKDAGGTVRKVAVVA